MTIPARKYRVEHPNIVLARTAAGGIVAGDVVRITGAGASNAPDVQKATATVAANVSRALMRVIEGVDGSTTPGAGDFVRCLIYGTISSVPYVGGPPSVGDDVYVDDAGVLSITAGTVSRVVGAVLADEGGGLMTVWFVGWAPPNLANIAPADAAYLTNGSVAGLTSEVNIGALAATMRFAWEDAPNNDTLSPLTLQHTPNGVAASGIGVRLPMVTHSDTGNTRIAAAVDGVLFDVTDAAEEGQIRIHALVAGVLTRLLTVGGGGLYLDAGGTVGNLSSPSASSDAATKGYVDGLAVHGYGGYYVSTPATTTIAVQSSGGPTGDNYVKVAGTTTAQPLRAATMPSDNRLTYTGTPGVVAKIEATVAFTTIGNHESVGFALALNGAKLDRTYTVGHVDTAGDVNAASITALITLATNDYLEVWAGNESSANDVEVSAMIVSAILVAT